LEKLKAVQLDANFFSHIYNNSYPGRIILGGLTENGLPVFLYATMGRQFDSQNCIFVRNGDTVKTEIADETRPPANPELTLYDAMGNITLQVPRSIENSTEQVFIVTNGKQTTDLLTKMKETKAFAIILKSWKHEPDSNATPRISGMMIVGENPVPRIEFSVIKKAPVLVIDENDSQHNFFNIELKQPGLGFCISTYMGDGNPLPSFKGEPIEMPIKGNYAEEIANQYWEALNSDNRVSLVVQVITKNKPFLCDWHIINRFQKINK